MKSGTRSTKKILGYGQARPTTVATVASPITNFNENLGLGITMILRNRASPLTCNNEYISHKGS